MSQRGTPDEPLELFDDQPKWRSKLTRYLGVIREQWQTLPSNQKIVLSVASVVLLIVLLLLSGTVLVGLWRNSSGHRDTDNSAPAEKIKAPQLWMDYGDNTARADTQFRGRRVETNGTVKNITSRNGKYVLGFEVMLGGSLSREEFERLSPKEREEFNQGPPPGVLSYFQPGKELTQIKPGCEVTLTGICVGRKDGSGPSGYVVVLEDCRLGSVIPPPKFQPFDQTPMFSK